MNEDKRNLGILYSDVRNIRRKGFNKNPDVMRASAEKVANIGFFLVLGAWVGQLSMFLLAMMGAGTAGILVGYVALGLALAGTAAAVVTLTFVWIKQYDNRQMKSAVPTAVAALVIAVLYFIIIRPVV